MNKHKKENKRSKVTRPLSPRNINAKSTEAVARSYSSWPKFALGVILVFSLFLFARATNYQFLIWDDNEYILNNKLLHDFSWKGLMNIFSTPVIGMYNPLPFVLYFLLFHFAGPDPAVFHSLNIFLHLGATFMAYQFILKLTKRYEPAAIVAVLFAIHPMHVSVATWISQTKTSMFAIFYFAGLVCYINYLRNEFQVKTLVYAGIFFLLSVLSKPSAVTFAPVLFLIDFYEGRKAGRRLFLEKIPFFMLSLAFGITTLLTHSEDTIFQVNNNYSLVNKLLIANYSVVFYFNKLFLPINLSALYAYPENTTILPLRYYLSLPVIPAIVFLIYKSGNFRKEMIFGILYFFITISVLVRFMPSGFFGAANRYSYMAYTGLFFIIAQFITYVIDGKFSFAYKRKKYILAGSFVLLLFYSVLTNERINVWENTITLFDDVIEKKQEIPVVYNNRGFARMQIGDRNGALQDYNKAISLYPEYDAAYTNRGLLNNSLGQKEEAYVDFNRALELNPRSGATYFNRGLIRSQLSDMDGALSDMIVADSLGIPEAKEQIRYIKSIKGN
jgi:tetratricopeptide (TPR) repeat protein